MLVICFICRGVLEEPGALVFSPPVCSCACCSNEVYKHHICAQCWSKLLAWLREAQQAADQARADARYAKPKKGKQPQEGLVVDSPAEAELNLGLKAGAVAYHRRTGTSLPASRRAVEGLLIRRYHARMTNEY